MDSFVIGIILQTIPTLGKLWEVISRKFVVQFVTTSPLLIVSCRCKIVNELVCESR